ncbi:hypothetical protein [Scleromatobacter humisilvae]|uniref:Uncharacterized protein n=1 Tax=Scleromatobacter humisilvae TaxID=2897159 RepID=A0A9X2C240_9BURK|nr:hypothetical protein [Scleromatobacter humisilvae]MCK9686404.1 hypothetical protein [Scleromatobacter humisilvae]
MMKRVLSFRPILIGAASACAVLAVGMSRPVQAVNAALVNVTNTSANRVPVAAVDDRTLQPFGTRLFPSVRNYATIAVPADKRLVLTGVTGFNNGDGSVSDLEIDATSSGMGNATRIPFAPTASTTFLRFLQNYNVYMVADPGTTVYFFIDDANINDGAGINIDVHGYWTSVN